jgi:ubiquinone biosynthesis protein
MSGFPTLRNARPYRVLCLSAAVSVVLPRYLLLNLRELTGVLPPSSAAWERAHEFAAFAIEHLASHLRGAFIKLAQVVGARPDVFPEPFGRRLQQFHDAVAPRSFASWRHHLAEQFDRPLTEIFSDIDPVPLAAASLAQVHRATLCDGTPVAIKLQYPEVHRVVPRDIAQIRRVGWLVTKLGALDLATITKELAKYVTLEIDFAREARSTETVAKNFEHARTARVSGQEGWGGSQAVDGPEGQAAGSAHAGLDARAEVRIPKVYSAYSGSRVIVLEYLDGIKITEVPKLEAAGHDPREVIARVARIYTSMVFDQGFFQGDPHPGNLLVMPDGRIGLLDFGMCKELPPGFATKVARLTLSALGGDAEAFEEAAESLGIGGRGVTVDSLSGLMRGLLDGFSGGASPLDVLGSGPIDEIPDDLPLILRTFVLLGGLAHTLTPGQPILQLELLYALVGAAGDDY